MRRHALKSGAQPAPDRWIFAGLLLLLIWLPLPWGSNPAAATSLFGLVAALLMLWRLSLSGGGRLPLPPLPDAARFAIAIWTLWLSWIAVQLLPLPSNLLEWVSPIAYERHSALAEIPAVASLFSLSVLPGAGLDHLLLSLSYFALFWVALVSIARNRYRQRLLLWVVVIAGLAQALYGIVMTLSGWEYGFLEQKTSGLGLATGTFVNRNHLAGYMELTLSAGIALILADLRPTAAQNWRERLAGWVDLAMSPRMRIRVMLAVMVIALVLTRSRMGNIAFFSSLLLCGCLYIFLRHKEVFVRSLIFFLSLILVDLLIVSERYGLEKVAQRIETTDWETEQRSQVFEELRPVVQELWWTGSGLGTFAAAYSPYRSDRVQRYVDHAHNDHLEYLIETGVIGYALLSTLGGAVLLHGLLTVIRRKDPMACALGFVGPMALTCLTIHGLADFNLQIPANAATLLVLMAASLSCSSTSRRERSNRGTENGMGTGDVPGTPPGADQ